MKIEIEISTVNQFLKRKSLGSKVFRKKLGEVFKEDFIVLSPKEQIQNNVNSIYLNIKEYRTNDDLNMLRELKELCTKNKLSLELSKMYRNIAKYHFYKNVIGYAIAFMDDAITNLMEYENEKKYLIEWKSDLALMYYYQYDYKNAKMTSEEVKELIEPNMEIDDNIMYLHYYRCGLVDNEIHNYFIAERMFLKSIEYAKSSDDIGDSYCNVGVSFRRRNKYKEAIEYYNKALQVYDSDYNRSIAYNNLADCFKYMGKYDEALKNIKLAFNHLSNGHVSQRFICYQTYAQIQILKGKYGDAINKLYELIVKIDNIHTYKNTVIDGIKTLIDYSIKTDNINMLDYIREFTIKLIKETDEEYENYLHKLYAFLGEIKYHEMDLEEQKENN